MSCLFGQVLEHIILQVFIEIQMQWTFQSEQSKFRFYQRLESNIK